MLLPISACLDSECGSIPDSSLLLKQTLERLLMMPWVEAWIEFLPSDPVPILGVASIEELSLLCLFHVNKQIYIKNKV